ncbi:MAG: DUF3098 domain-containing protein [Bacteroidaceae bacterium]|nr:DUF3098 domain-containing protein [Bacteroidaceae bacterium]
MKEKRMKRDEKTEKKLFVKSSEPTGRKKTMRCAFGWQNFALIGVCVSFIISGLIMMLPEEDVRNRVGGRYAAAPGPGAFDARRIRAAPIPCFIGFVGIIPAILFIPFSKRQEEQK